MLLVILSSVGCGGGPSTLERARCGAGLRAGFAIEPPYAFVRSDGRITGESPEVLRVVLDDVGVHDIQWVSLEFADLIPALRDRRIDVIAAGMFITHTRAARVRFTRPTACVGTALLVGRSAPPTLDRLAAAARSTARIVVLDGSIEQRLARSVGIPPERLLSVPDLRTALAALRLGDADAFAISAPTARYVAAASDSTAAPLTARDASGEWSAGSGCAAFAVRPGDAALAAAMDSVLERFVGSPRHIELVRPFGFRPAEVRRARDVAAVAPVPEMSR